MKSGFNFKNSHIQSQNRSSYPGAPKRQPGILKSRSGSGRFSGAGLVPGHEGRRGQVFRVWSWQEGCGLASHCSKEQRVLQGQAGRRRHTPSLGKMELGRRQNQELTLLCTDVGIFISIHSTATPGPHRALHSGARKPGFQTLPQPSSGLK